MSKLLVASMLALIAFAAPAMAWDTSPWSTAPFDQPTGITASQAAKVGAATAHGLAMSKNTGGQKATTSPVTSFTSAASCQLNVGTATVASNGSTPSVFTNVNVKGDIINICR